VADHRRHQHAGWCAVAAAYGTVGVMFVLAAIRHDPAKAGGLAPA
jgi:hypothetical protein